MTRLPVLRRVPHRLVREVVDKGKHDRVRRSDDPLGAARGKAHKDTRRKSNEKNGNE